jgi:hypothetical protein
MTFYVQNKESIEPPALTTPRRGNANRLYLADMFRSCRDSAHTVLLAMLLTTVLAGCDRSETGSCDPAP